MQEDELTTNECEAVEALTNMVNRTAPCIAVYLSTFSKPPFGDVWSLDGEKVPGLLLNTNANIPFIQQLLLDPTVEYIQKDNAEGDEAVVSRVVIIDHLTRFLEDPYTQTLLNEQGILPSWISQDEINQLSVLLKRFTESEDPTVRISIPYSLRRKIFEAYSTTVQDPDSLVLLNYLEPDNACAVQMIRITPDTIVPQGVLPIGVTRTKTLNATRESLEQRSGFRLPDDLVPEIDYYLQGENLQEVLDAISQKAHTSYLAEIAVSPEPSEGMATLSSLEAVLSGMGGILPDQVIYLTLEGTPVSRLTRSGKSTLATAINYGVRDHGQGQYEEERFEFKTEIHGTVIIGVLRRVGQRI